MSAIVLLSGGQDSATCLAIAKQAHNQIHCICFDYGQRHRVEIECSQKLAKHAGAFQLVDLSFVAQISNSAMIHNDQAIQIGPNELPNTFVPGRNALFLTIAASVAYEKGWDIIFTGVCQTDYSGYPDCREVFIQAQERTLRLAMQSQVRIITPLMHLTKADTVTLMHQLGHLDWYKDTHTCYEGKQPPCANCPSCKLRQNGFESAGIPDPLFN
ncbi:MAG: 7-cyano-7-deazaguanine synthase QueC [Candidatus Margulisiibacteriota bacterium]